MDLLNSYWAQITVVFVVFGYILKIILDYRLKNKELRNKYFYELKAKKLIELYSMIVEIQMFIDRQIGGEKFESNILGQRIGLDKYYWECEFYFYEKTQRLFRAFLEHLKFYETTQIMKEHPEIEQNFKRILKRLLKELKKELLYSNEECKISVRRTGNCLEKAPSYIIQ